MSYWPGPKETKLWHDAMADILLLAPALTCEEIAEQLSFQIGRRFHVQTIEHVRRSDMFEAIMRRRRATLENRLDDDYAARMQGKIGKLAELSVDKLAEELERERNKMLDTVQRSSLETCEMALKAVGLIKSAGDAPAAVHTHQHNTVIVTGDVLASARAKMRSLNVEPGGSEDGGEVGNTPLLPAPAQLP